MTTDDYEIVPLPGSEGWESAYKWAQQIEASFPGQDADELAYAIEYNDAGPLHYTTIAYLELEQRGENDGPAWVWRMTLADATMWRATGSCDYTGWDCQSSLYWEQI